MTKEFDTTRVRFDEPSRRWTGRGYPRTTALRRYIWRSKVPAGVTTVLIGALMLGTSAARASAASCSFAQHRHFALRPVRLSRPSSTAAGDRVGTQAPFTTTTSALLTGRTPTPPSSADTAAQYAQQVAALVNIERVKYGCRRVTVSPKLRLAAQRHTDDMVTRHFFAHTNPDGVGPGGRLDAVGYRWRAWGENIAYGQATPTAVMGAWMHSPGHRANILNCRYRDIGVGVNLAANGPYWTQDFGTPL